MPSARAGSAEPANSTKSAEDAENVGARRGDAGSDLPMSHDIAFSVAHPDCPPPLLPGPFGVASFGQDHTGQAARSASRYRNGTAQPRYLARNSAIFVPACAMWRTPLRWPFGPSIATVSTGVPLALIAAAVRSIHSWRKTWSVGV